MFNCTAPTFMILYSFEKEERNFNSISIQYILHIFFLHMFVDFSQTAWPSAWFLLDSARYILPLAPLQNFLYLFLYTIFFSFKNPIFTYVRRLLWSGLSNRDVTFLILRQQNLSSLFVVKYRYCKLHITSHYIILRYAISLCLIVSPQTRRRTRWNWAVSLNRVLYY